LAIATLGLAVVAGVLSTLSPCVLPILPIILATALSKHRLGVAALAGGLTLSFVTIGLFIATIGFAAGIDERLFRSVSAILLIGIGAVLLVPRFQSQFALAAGPVSNWTEHRFGGFLTDGMSGQFLVGLLLGAVWTPCVGPTLGAASIMAARGENLGQVAVTMLLFGIGAAIPLLVLGQVSRATLMRWRDRLLVSGSGGRRVLGGILVAFGVLTLTGLDRIIQTTLVGNTPQWLTDITTRF
jgi:cytochrome c-type biogenesis protein